MPIPAPTVRPRPSTRGRSGSNAVRSCRDTAWSCARAASEGVGTLRSGAGQGTRSAGGATAPMDTISRQPTRRTCPESRRRVT